MKNSIRRPANRSVSLITNLLYHFLGKFSEITVMISFRLRYNPVTATAYRDSPSATVTHSNITVHHRPSPSITIHHHSSPSITVHHRPSPSITAHHRPLPSITVHYRPSPSITVPDRFSPLREKFSITNQMK